MLRWLQAKTQTRWSFVLIYGVVMFGGLSALLMTLGPFARSPQDISLVRLLSIWIIFPAGGVVWGLMMYEWQRWMHRRLLRRNRPAPGPGPTS